MAGRIKSWAEGNRLVSVVMPAYNRERVISRAIRSVLSQGYRDFELLVVDDGSTDHTCDVVVGIDDPRIKLIRASENRGAAAARNKGIKQAAGSLISFLDSDDEYLPRFLEESVKKLSTAPAQVGMVWTGVTYLDEESSKERTAAPWKPRQTEGPYTSFLRELHVGAGSGVMIRREVFDVVGYFDEDLRAAEDTEFFIRVSRNYSFDQVPESLLRIYKSDNNRLSLDFTRMAVAYEKIVAVNIDEITQRPELRKKYFYKLMWLHYHTGSKQAARKYFNLLNNKKEAGLKTWILFLIFEALGSKLGSRIHLSISRSTMD